MRSALWLLRTVGSGPSIDALIGDLMEERKAGKSVAWLWGQVVLAIASTFVADIRRHPFYLLRASSMTLGLVALLALAMIELRPWVGVVAETYLPEHDPYVTTGTWVIQGVTHTHTLSFPWAMMVYAPFAMLTLYMLGAWTIGSVVRRCHRRTPTSAVLAATMLLASIVLMVGILDPPSPNAVEMGWWDAWSATPLTITLGLLLGGLRRRSRAEVPSAL
jgi:hypothetical protein